MVTQICTRWSFSLMVLVLLAVIVLLLPVHGRTQVAEATLSGSITNPSGSFIPGAQIAVTNTATGITATVTSNSAGIYTAPNLIPGSYKVTISAAGFRRVSQTGITLTVGAQQVLNMTMTVGVATQTINVTGVPPALDLTSSTISATVGENEVRGLPLNGRDWTTIATLQPGVNSLASVQTNNLVTGFCSWQPRPWPSNGCLWRAAPIE
jgi:Carboxypeptidase regulatory-like domain